MTLVFYIIVAFILLIALGQGQNYLRSRTIKKYFRTNELDYVLVCNDSVTTEHWKEKIDKGKYSRIEIINIHDFGTGNRFIDGRLLESTVRKVGVMRYPCLLTIEDNEIKGKVFE